MKVSAVNNYRLNNTHFAGRKNIEIQKPVHSSNPIKAIPVAVLIAMSPLNAPLQAQDSLIQKEYAMNTDNNNLGHVYDKGTTSDGTRCRMIVNDSEEGKKSVEISLIKRITSYAIDSKNNIVKAYRVREVELVPEKIYKKTEVIRSAKGNDEVQTKYYVIGSGTEYTSVPLVNNPYIHLKDDTQPIVQKFKNSKYEINIDLYKSLKSVLKK